MNKIFFLLAMVLLFVSCSKEPEKPQNILPKVTLVRVMADMGEAEAKIKSLRVSTDSARQIYREYEKSIFEQYGISSEQYQKSYQYYLLNYEDMSEIHSAVYDTLTNRHQKATRN